MQETIAKFKANEMAIEPNTNDILESGHSPNPERAIKTALEKPETMHHITSANSSSTSCISSLSACLSDFFFMFLRRSNSIIAKAHIRDETIATAPL